MQDGQTILKKGRKFDQVLDAACALFLTEGFHRTNMDHIAARANVSKATVYSYFPDKKLLFLEAVRTEIARRAVDAEAGIPVDAPVRMVLEFSARILIGFYMSDFAKKLYRLSIAEAESFPELARMFHNSGSKMAQDRISGYFAEAANAGDMIIDDPDLAAAQFIELCKADIFERSMLGLTPAISEADIVRVSKGAVEMFLARYGPDSGRTHG
ncbi:MAG: TetR/AcrR family transcriptional regulator [Paracoccaceae bacterium]|jgi:AcrR family transcriptional regulator|nr:TetR/AcrR family transcriptional regulator [Paracoccaceae bacterium]MDP7186495.1 TetR/AcrR family transcriptional regulator [Paracoccaceae bacterium]